MRDRALVVNENPEIGVDGQVRDEGAAGENLCQTCGNEELRILGWDGERQSELPLAAGTNGYNVMRHGIGAAICDIDHAQPVDENAEGAGDCARQLCRGRLDVEVNVVEPRRRKPHRLKLQVTRPGERRAPALGAPRHRDMVQVAIQVLEMQVGMIGTQTVETVRVRIGHAQPRLRTCFFWRDVYPATPRRPKSHLYDEPTSPALNEVARVPRAADADLGTGEEEVGDQASVREEFNAVHNVRLTYQRSPAKARTKCRQSTRRFRELNDVDGIDAGLRRVQRSVERSRYAAVIFSAT